MCFHVGRLLQLVSYYIFSSSFWFAFLCAAFRTFTILSECSGLSMGDETVRSEVGIYYILHWQNIAPTVDQLKKTVQGVDFLDQIRLPLKGSQGPADKERREKFCNRAHLFSVPGLTRFLWGHCVDMSLKGLMENHKYCYMYDSQR